MFTISTPSAHIRAHAMQRVATARLEKIKFLQRSRENNRKPINRFSIVLGLDLDFDCFRTKIEFDSSSIADVSQCHVSMLVRWDSNLKNHLARALARAQQIFDIKDECKIVTLWNLTCDIRFFDFRFFETEIEVRSRLSETELDRRLWLGRVRPVGSKF